MLRLFILICVFVNGASAEGIKEINSKIRSQNSELESIQKEIQSTKKKKEQLKKSESDLLQTIKSLESEISFSKKKEENLKSRVQETEAKIEELQSRSGQYSRDAQIKEIELAQAFGQYWVDQQISGFEAPLNRWASRSSISHHYTDLQKTQSERDKVLEQHSNYRNQKKQMEVLRSGVSKEIEKQILLESRKRALYGKTQSQRLAAEKELSTLERNAKEMEDLLSRLMAERKKIAETKEETSSKRKAFLNKKGNYPWPVEGKVVSNFGKHKHKDLGILVVQNGIRIRSVANAAVQAIDNGVVVFASTFRSYGKTVILDHGGNNFSVYGGLEKISVQVDSRIGGGDVLGVAPDSSSGDVYFEIRRDGTAQDPLEWLR